MMWLFCFVHHLFVNTSDIKYLIISNIWKFIYDIFTTLLNFSLTCRILSLYMCYCSYIFYNQLSQFSSNINIRYYINTLMLFWPILGQRKKNYPSCLFMRRRTGLIVSLATILFLMAWYKYAGSSLLQLQMTLTLGELTNNKLNSTR